MDETRENPYRELPGFVKRYVERDVAKRDLLRKLYNGVNTVVMGVEGVGKSALFASVFTPGFCKEMARDRHILINRISYPTDLETDDIYSFFADAVRDAAAVLDDCGENELYADIMRRADRYQKEYQEGRREPQSYFQKICQHIRGTGCYVVLVIDQFERFTSSKYVTQEHHSIMRNILVTNNLCFVVATDFDFDRGSLPSNAAGSLLLQLFAGHEISIKGFDEEQCGCFLRGISGREDFTPEELGKLSRLTGGIPALLCPAARCAFEYKLRGEDVSWRQVKEAVLKDRDCCGLMARWLGILTEQEADLLRELSSQTEEAIPIPADLRDGAAPLLLTRGLIAELGDHCYDFNSRLFQFYCIKNPPGSSLPSLKSTTVLSPPEPAARPESWPVHLPWPPQGGVVYYEDRSTHVHSDGGTIESGAVQICNTSIHSHGLSVSEVLGMLGEGENLQKFLADRLSECRLSPGGARPGLTQAGQEQQDQVYDADFSERSENYLADVDEISAQEIETLDERFAQARARCGRGVTDELLASMSERCRIYLKLSLVVEDALSILNSETMQDHSPQLVLYGKALEQTLRDNLFELFRREEQLSVYDTYTHRRDEKSSNSFLNKSAGKSFIGNFTCLIRSQQNYLGKLCAREHICAAGEPLSEKQWCSWWGDLQKQIDKAREIRNLADHPDDRIPAADDLNAMCDLLLGTEEKPGILARTTVGRALFLSLFPPKIGFLTGRSMVGSQTVFRCMERTKQGGLKGRLSIEGYEASVSPRQLERYCASLSGADFEPVGALLNAVILEFKTEGERSFFNLELLP